MVRLLQPLVNPHCVKQPGGRSSSTLISLLFPNLVHTATIICAMHACASFKPAMKLRLQFQELFIANLIINCSVPQNCHSTNTVNAVTMETSMTFTASALLFILAIKNQYFNDHAPTIIGGTLLSKRVFLLVSHL